MRCAKYHIPSLDPADAALDDAGIRRADYERAGEPLPDPPGVALGVRARASPGTTCAELPGGAEPGGFVDHGGDDGVEARVLVGGDVDADVAQVRRHLQPHEQRGTAS